MSADSRITVATEMHEHFPEIDDLDIQTGTFRDTQINS